MKLTFVAAAAFALASQVAMAAPSDYRFDVVGQKHQADGTDTVTVRVVRITDGKPVQGAIVFEPRVTMSGMSMAAPSKVLPPAPDGSAVIQVTPSMPGPWTLSLSARVNGEPAVIKGAVDVELGK
jgi:hypothetical protein